MSRKVDWFDRGRDAFTEGLPCEISDARISGADRQRWREGWNHQRELNTPDADEEARAETVAALRAIRESLSS